tara:strand:- start:1094 stop:1813 length:720 start_codon:yes stop_codon:yes gene_type:complete
MTSKHIINCPCCFKTFKKKGCYEKHIFDCQRTNDERNPTNKELYAMITVLTEKYNNVQYELETLKRYTNTYNKKIDVLYWLNNINKDLKHMEKYNFYNHIHNLEIDLIMLEGIFKNGYIDGVFDIFITHLQSIEYNQIIQCFEQKKNLLYIFDKGWKLLEDKQFVILFTDIHKKVLNAFDKYKIINEHKLLDEDYQTEFNDNFMKILCVDVSFETQCNRFKSKLFNKLKEVFKSIELEI